jgi:hypothetical protein
MSPLSPATVNIEIVRNAYERAASSSKKRDVLSFDQVISEPLDDLWLRKFAQYTSRLLVTREEAAQGHLFVNGKYYAFGGVSGLALNAGLGTDGAALDCVCPVRTVHPASLHTGAGKSGIAFVHESTLPDSLR